MRQVSDKDYTEEYYQFHERYTEKEREFIKTRNEEVTNLVLPKKGDFILDLGCGIGTFTIECAKRGAFTVGLDFSEPATKTARRRAVLSNSSGNSEIIRGDVTHLSFKPETFDLLIIADLVEHLYEEQYKKTIKEWYRVLKKNGKVMLLTPNTNCLFEKFPSLLKPLLIVMKDKEMLKHLSSFSYLHVSLKPLKYLSESLKENGFSLMHISYYPIASKGFIFKIIAFLRTKSPRWIKERVESLFYQQISLLAKK
ncbi:hypothetical protein B6V00_01010 [ANME-1 cluster archaeon ex4572_4]|nr:MAG: hypothetical protein B6V00_01010 [ANME-1 cluster archaeon ex4572_4]